MNGAKGKLMDSDYITKTEDVLVSVYCMAYNHVDTIKQTIESIICQKTDFAFEILIHDDASDDGTADIIREYAEKYPDIIRPIFQNQNRFKDCNIYREYLNPIAKGKLIAICEGDDYWIDPNKLKRQAEFMLLNTDCSMTFHAVKQLTGDGKVSDFRPLKSDGFVPVEQLIRRGGLFCPTVSLMFRRDVIENWPKFREMADIYDYPLQLLSACMGRVYYFDFISGVYRFAVNNSWTAQRQNKVDIKHLENETSWVEEFNIYTCKKYEDAVNFHLAHLYITEYRKSFDKSVKLKAKQYVSKLGFRDKIILNTAIVVFSVLKNKGNIVFSKIKKMLLR